MPQVARQGRRAQRKTARDSGAVPAPILSPLRARLGLTQHRHGSQDAFDETRAGRKAPGSLSRASRSYRAA